MGHSWANNESVTKGYYDESSSGHLWSKGKKEKNKNKLCQSQNTSFSTWCLTGFHNHDNGIKYLNQSSSSVIALLIISTPSRVVFIRYSKFLSLESSIEMIHIKKYFFLNIPIYYFQHFIMKISNIAMLEEFYNEHSYTYHLDSINSTYFITYPFIFLSIYQSISQLFVVFQRKLQISSHFSLVPVPTFIFISDLQGIIDEKNKGIFWMRKKSVNSIWIWKQ